mmetsp:Transcript_14107/g.43089  ORF Transcript_14107/g.43089 Transcript_14107/m.43089 type:complete len:222 (+) Transcript_14107:2270-2935(+)
MKNLVDDEAAPARNSLLRAEAGQPRLARLEILVRHALDPRKDEPQRPAERVDRARRARAGDALVARRFGDRKDDVALHPGIAVRVIHRHEGRGLAVGRAALSNLVALGLHRASRARVASRRGEDNRLGGGCDGEEVRYLAGHTLGHVHNQLARLRRDDVCLFTDAPAALTRWHAPLVLISHAGGLAVGGRLGTRKATSVPVAHAEACRVRLRALLEERVEI